MEYIDSLESRGGRPAIKYRMNMTRLATNYKATNVGICCPLCKRREDNSEHMTKCLEYKQMDKELNVSELYSENAQGSTVAIKERMDQCRRMLPSVQNARRQL